MSKVRRAKKLRGKDAPNWKGGFGSTNRRIRGYLHKIEGWYFNIYKRDGFKCVLCGSVLNIDAHHITPISVLIKKHLDGNDILEKDAYDFLINQEDILDKKLENGITLCRVCHKKIHNRWGSHNQQ